MVRTRYPYRCIMYYLLMFIVYIPVCSAQPPQWEKEVLWTPAAGSQESLQWAHLSPNGRNWWAYASADKYGILMTKQGRRKIRSYPVERSIWSDDGDSFAFPVTDEEGNRRYWVNLTPLKGSWKSLGGGSFSPDGKHFAYSALEHDGPWYIVRDGKKTHPHYLRYWIPYWISVDQVGAMIRHIGPRPDYNDQLYYATGPLLFGPFDTFHNAIYYVHSGPQLMVHCSQDGLHTLFLNDTILAQKEEIKVFTVDDAGRPFFTFRSKGKGWFISYNGREFGPVDQVLGSRTDKVNGFLSLVRKGGADHLLSPQGWAGPYGRILSWNASLSGQGEPVLETVRTDGTRYIWHGNVAYGPYSKVIVDREPGLSVDGKHCWYAAVRWGGTDLHAYLDGEPIGPAVDAIKPEMAYCQKFKTLAFAGKRKDSWSVFFNDSWLEAGYSDIYITHGVNSDFGFVALGTEKSEGAAELRVVLTATATYGPFDKTGLYVSVSPSGTSWVARVHNEAGWRVLLDGVSSPSLANVFDGFEGPVGGPTWTADGPIVVLGADKEGSLIRLVGRKQTEQ